MLGEKSKTTAVLLAVFLSFWTWLYTFDKNKWKFFIGLAAGIAIVVLFGVGGAMRRDDTTFACRFYNQQCAGVGYDVTALLAAIALWIWAIVDVSIRSSAWYSRYSDA